MLIEPKLTNTAENHSKENIPNYPSDEKNPDILYSFKKDKTKVLLI